MADMLTPLPLPPDRLASPNPRHTSLDTVPFEPGILVEIPPRRLPMWPDDAMHQTKDFNSPKLAVFPIPPALVPFTSAPLASLPFSTPRPAFSPVVEKPVETQPAISADFTDEDLREALKPIFGAFYTTGSSVSDPSLEPMLRSTIRRALAEYSPASRPFKPPGALDRFVWRMQALFSSRSYEDILFEKTNRFQVEEVFLLDSSTLALVSFASCDPARHSSARRVEGTAQRLALQMVDETKAIRETFTLADGRSVVACAGSHAVLAAIVRGEAGDLLRSDLEYALHRIENRFRERFRNDGTPLMRTLQPYLEDCLLIQSPASAA